MNLEGAIYWLPPRPEIQDDHAQSISKINRNWFGHPVLLVRQLTSDQALFCLITTHPGRHVPLDWSQFLPFSPGQPHPDNGILLTFQTASQFDRPSWVRLETFQTSLRVVRQYRLNQYRQGLYSKLDAVSVKQVQKALGLRLPGPRSQTPSLQPKSRRHEIERLPDKNTVVQDSGASRTRHIQRINNTPDRPTRYLWSHIPQTYNHSRQSYETTPLLPYHQPKEPPADDTSLFKTMCIATSLAAGGFLLWICLRER